MTTDEAKMVLAVLSAAFPHARADDDTVLVYCEALRDLDYSLAEQAARSLLLTAERFMPSPAEIRKRVVELRDGAVKSGLEAWGVVRKAIGRFGIYRTPGVDFRFDDPIAALVVDSIGWRELCNGDIDNQVADRARFVQAYDQIARDDARARQSGGLLPERVSPKLLARGVETMQPIGKLLALPSAARRFPWEDE